MKIETLLLSGGGIKGIATSSALEVLQNEGKLNDVKRIIGSSIGALIAVLMCCNFTPKQIKLILKGVNLSQFQTFDISLFLTKFGFDDGQEFEKFFNCILQSKNCNPNITFEELHKTSKYELVLVGTNISKSIPVYFNYKNYPTMPVKDALRISAGYPIAFTPSIINNEKYADGAIVSPLASEYIKEEEKETTLGIAIHRGFTTYNTDKPHSYLFSIIGCIIDSLTNWNVKNIKHCILISYPLHAMDFDITNEQKDDLEETGKKSARDWLQSN